MSSMMRVIAEQIGRVGVSEVPVPSPGPGQVLVRAALAGVCGSDTHAVAGHHPLLAPPYYPGHEATGTVAEVGPEVAFPAVGQRVMLKPNVCCGECVNCRAGRTNVCQDLRWIGCDPSGALPGAMADYLLAPAGNLYAVPDEVTDRQAVLVECLATGVHAARIAGDVTGARVVVLGAGTIGLFAVMAARPTSSSTVWPTSTPCRRPCRCCDAPARFWWSGCRRATSRSRCHWCRTGSCGSRAAPTTPRRTSSPRSGWPGIFPRRRSSPTAFLSRRRHWHLSWPRAIPRARSLSDLVRATDACPRTDGSGTAPPRGAARPDAGTGRDCCQRRVLGGLRHRPADRPGGLRAHLVPAGHWPRVWRPCERRGGEGDRFRARRPGGCRPQHLLRGLRVVPSPGIQLVRILDRSRHHPDGCLGREGGSVSPSGGAVARLSGRRDSRPHRASLVRPARHGTGGGRGGPHDAGVWGRSHRTDGPGGSSGPGPGRLCGRAAREKAGPSAGTRRCCQRL